MTSATASHLLFIPRTALCLSTEKQQLDLTKQVSTKQYSTPQHLTAWHRTALHSTEDSKWLNFL